MKTYDLKVHWNNRTLTDFVCQRERYLKFERDGSEVTAMDMPDHIPASFGKQREHRENEVKLAMDLLEQFKDDPESTENILDTAFPQNFTACDLPDGICEFQEECFPGGIVSAQ